MCVTTVPAPVDISIAPEELVYTVNDTIILNCTVSTISLDNSFINSQLTTTFEWKLHQSTISSTVYDSPPSYNIYSKFHHLDNISLSDAGKYSCSVYVNDIDNGIQSDIITEYRDITIRGKL